VPDLRGLDIESARSVRNGLASRVERLSLHLRDARAAAF
jgi:hypothetical protein